MAIASPRRRRSCGSWSRVSEAGDRTATPSAASPLRICLVTPARRGSRGGNRITALRLAGLLRQLGMRPRVVEAWRGEACDVLFAIHAAKSAPSVLAATAARPALRVVVLLAGTDIYPHYAPSAATAAVLERADALVALQPHAAAALPPALRGKVHTIVQSATAAPPRRGAVFRACVLAHLRPVKDPLLPIRALSQVPATLPLELVLAGRALSEPLAAAVRAAVAAEPRARWVGELPHRAARELLASSHVCLVPSTAEGGANVLSEAIAAGTPVLASAIPGNLGLLGDDWPGLFAAEDSAALAALLVRAHTDPRFAMHLQARTLALQAMVAPARERAALAALLDGLGCHRRPTG